MSRHDRRKKPAGYTLTEDDARIVKGMLKRGDRQHDIAAYFGVNAGRIADISTGLRFREAPARRQQHLPPPGPYSVRDLMLALHDVHTRVLLGDLGGAQKLLDERLDTPS